MTDRLVAPENDYRSLLDVPTDPPVDRVTVVIPVYNRVDLLARTLAGLVSQTYPMDLLSVVVADDGSTEDVPAAVDQWRDRVDVTVVRREHEGYGAGQARNLGARSTDAEVLVFVDADCVPGPGMVAAHAGWHRRASNLVVIGSRHHLDTSDLAAADIADGRWAPSDGSGAPADWRDVFYRRTAQLRSGDEAFRSLVSSNFSIRREPFQHVGGFSEDFTRWGGEDTELGWRLFRGGLYFVVENDAVVHHQTQEDAGPEGWRGQARHANDGLIATKIPHRFYRRPRAGTIFEVPKVSWVVTPPAPERAHALLRDLLRQSHTDWQVVFHDPDRELTAFAELHRADPRIHVVADPDPLAAVRRARGELVGFLHGWASPDHRAAGRVVRRLDNRPRTTQVTVGVQTGRGEQAARWTHPTDVLEPARAWDSPVPVLAVVRGREIAKVVDDATDLGDLWGRLGPIARPAHLRDALVALPADEPAPDLPVDHHPFVSDRVALVRDLKASRDPRTVASSVARFARTRMSDEAYVPARAGTPARARPPAVAASAGEGADRVGVRYVGWVGKQNLGDEAMLAAVRALMPWADVQTSGDPTDLLLLGGGTLINRKIYLDWLRDKDSPRSERAVFGTGVASPAFWGQTEPAADWVEFLGTCAYVGVRGPRSEQTLRDWGYDGPLEVVGDPALALRRPEAVATVPGRLVVSPLVTGGELLAGTDEEVIDGLAETVGRAVADGREVWLLAAFPGDDRWCMEVMRRAGHPDLPHLAGYDDLDATLRLLASADVVVAERLHAAILAAAVDTPFVAVEYRPKVRDFAASLDIEHLLVDPSAVTAVTVLEQVRTIDADRDAIVGRITSGTATYRERLHRAADHLRSTCT